MRAILWGARKFSGEPVNPDAQVTVNFEDSYIIDKEAERERDRQDVRDGFMSKNGSNGEAEMYGEDESKAKSWFPAEMSSDELMALGVVEGNASPEHP